MAHEPSYIELLRLWRTKAAELQAKNVNLAAKIVELEKEIEVDDINLSRQFDLLQEAGLRVEELDKEVKTVQTNTLEQFAESLLFRGHLENTFTRDDVLEWAEQLKDKDMRTKVAQLNNPSHMTAMQLRERTVELEAKVAELEHKLALPFGSYTTQPAESVAGIALRKLGDEKLWVEIARLNSLQFPDVRANDYYPVGTVLTLPKCNPLKDKL